MLHAMTICNLFGKSYLLGVEKTNKQWFFELDIANFTYSECFKI